jgi:hypothetical protein
MTAPVAAIDTREELVDALTEASELEHVILLQYLFAAYSLKKRADEGLRPPQQETVRSWAAALTAVARQEMAHLGSVCNLLSAVGGAPRLGRPNFPQPRKRYYPFDLRLQAYGDEALYRFILFELPKGEQPPPPPRHRQGAGGAFAPDAVLEAVDIVPDPLSFEYLGELYAEIRRGFMQIPEDELFIGPRFAQDTDDWSNRFALRLVTDRASAAAALDAIVLEGEGAPGQRTPSHYSTFLGLRRQLAQQPEGFQPARPVVTDPRTRTHPDAPIGGTLIEHPRTLRVAELLNASYITVLLMLMQYYAFSGETPPQRDALRKALRNAMSGIIRPLAEVLTELPVGSRGGSGTAGPPFELYSDVRLATQLDNRWTILLERLDAAAEFADDLAGETPRVGFIAQNMAWLRLNVGAAAGATS